MAPIRRIGVLTGGGDCPGLNAVIRAVAKTAMCQYDLEILGIEEGFLGLIENRVRPLSNTDVSNILTRGGTILGTSNRADPERYAVGYNADGDPVFENVTDRCIATIKEHKIDALVCIGGDGTLTGAMNFINHGVPCIGVPKTIDNDLVGSEITFGFLTAVQTATDALDRLHTTASSHHRVMVCEVMGRNAGWIALHAGVASGSDVICIPEIPYDLGSICEFLKERQSRGKLCAGVCCADGARPKGGQATIARIDPTSPDPIRLGGVGALLAGDIERCINIETRSVNLGHVIRGGTPVAADRVLATRLGHHALELLMSGKQNRVAVVQNGELSDVAIADVSGKQRTIPLSDPLIEAARDVSTCFGEAASQTTCAAVS